MKKSAKFAGVVFLSIVLSGPALAGAVESDNWMIPNKGVVLRCPPLPYEIHCSISRLANPEYRSFCFYVADGQSYPMKRDYRFGFYNEIVSLKVHDGLRITGLLTDQRTGRKGRCVEAE